MCQVKNSHDFDRDTLPIRANFWLSYSSFFKMLSNYMIKMILQIGNTTKLVRFIEKGYLVVNIKK